MCLTFPDSTEKLHQLPSAVNSVSCFHTWRWEWLRPHAGAADVVNVEFQTRCFHESQQHRADLVCSSQKLRGCARRLPSQHQRFPDDAASAAATAASSSPGRRVGSL